MYAAGSKSKLLSRLVQQYLKRFSYSSEDALKSCKVHLTPSQPPASLAIQVEFHVFHKWQSKKLATLVLPCCALEHCQMCETMSSVSED